MFGKKNQAAEDGLDVLTEIKEPFSFANFFEDHVVGRIRAIKQFLEEKGILFFLLSPFQQRNRLIAQLTIITIGILLGVVPRCMKLINTAKERNASSEMASLISSNTELNQGSLLIRPLASSQYDKQHILAFSLTPNGSTPIPSTAKRYEVTLAASRGVLDMEHVSYSYEVLPISERQRLLLVYVDNRNQNDETGIFNLTIVSADDALGPDAIPLEIVLSNTQETTDLFDEEGIDLACLTDLILSNPNMPIASAWENFETSVHEYELETERIKALPLGMDPTPDVATLETFARSHTLYPELTDTSTTKDIADIAEREDDSSEFVYDVGITMNGTLYNKAYFEALTGSMSTDIQTADAVISTEGAAPSEEEETVTKELSSLQEKADAVLKALLDVNNACKVKYLALKDYKLMLNQTIDLTTFTSGNPLSDKVLEGSPSEGGDEASNAAEKSSAVQKEAEENTDIPSNDPIPADDAANNSDSLSQ